MKVTDPLAYIDFSNKFKDFDILVRNKQYFFDLHLYLPYEIFGQLRWGFSIFYRRNCLSKKREFSFKVLLCNV